MLFIALNMVVMAMDQFEETPTYSLVLERLNLFFIAVFTAECTLKIFALRWYYFKEPWNVFDFVVVLLSIAGEITFSCLECETNSYGYHIHLFQDTFLRS